jgi:hypothetical protein
VSTEAIRAAAERFIEVLDREQRDRTLFAVDDPEWRKWMNPHFYVRQGVSFGDMNEAQNDAAIEMLAASLSPKGLRLSQDIMKLNTTLGELNDNDFIQYGEDKYHITLMGTPSPVEPWGWQLEGHHLAVNYFVLGDQVVMSPVFWGSEPAVAESGIHAGTEVLVEEQVEGLAMVRALTQSQRAHAILDSAKVANNALAQAFQDNLVLDYAGVPVASFTEVQKEQLLGLVGLWIGNLRDAHAQVRMSEVKRFLDQTYFAWIGGTDDDSLFYYRIHSPVVLIEFDHQTPVGLRQYYPAGVPYREHIHAVVRTPNGNDYGKDLLRQHYATRPH